MVLQIVKEILKNNFLAPISLCLINFLRLDGNFIYPQIFCVQYMYFFQF